MGHHRATIQIFRQDARQLGRVRRFVQTAAYHNAHMLVRQLGKSPKNPLQQRGQQKFYGERPRFVRHRNGDSGRHGHFLKARAAHRRVQGRGKCGNRITQRRYVPRRDNSDRLGVGQVDTKAARAIFNWILHTCTSVWSAEPGAPRSED